MAKRRKAGPLFGVAGVAVVGALVYGTMTSGGPDIRTADTGGGALPAPSGEPAPYAISTLAPIGNAAQDPGGGGGGTGAPGTVGGPAIQGAQGSDPAPGFADAGDTLYFSGVALLDPNRSATYSGENTFGGPGLGSVTGALPQSDSSTGCAKPPQETDYYAIPLRNVVTFRGNPRVRMNISGGGSVTVSLYQQTQDDTCQLVGSGTTGIRGGVADLNLGVSSHRFPIGVTPVLVIRANDGAQHTITTSNQNPSFIYLPNLQGV